MLKKLSPKHHAIIRGLILGDTPQEIAFELGMRPEYISQLQKDPLFRAELSQLELKVSQRVVVSASEEMPFKILEEGSARSARLCVSAMDGEVDGVEVPMNQRLLSARDILDRTGYSGVKKTVFANVGEMISDAYQRRNKG